MPCMSHHGSTLHCKKYCARNVVYDSDYLNVVLSFTWLQYSTSFGLGRTYIGTSMGVVVFWCLSSKGCKRDGSLLLSFFGKLHKKLLGRSNKLMG